jgi:hypothetical protein
MDYLSFNETYADFHNLTFLYKEYVTYDFDKYIFDFVSTKYEDVYFKKIKDYISENKSMFKDGDIIFIGSTYETRQEYGFAVIVGDDFKSGEYPDLELVKGVYYGNAINKINNFWKKYIGENYFDDEYMEYLKKNGFYEP